MPGFIVLAKYSIPQFINKFKRKFLDVCSRVTKRDLLYAIVPYLFSEGNLPLLENCTVQLSISILFKSVVHSGVCALP